MLTYYKLWEQTLVKFQENAFENVVYKISAILFKWSRKEIFIIISAIKLKANESISIKFKCEKGKWYQQTQNGNWKKNNGK